MTFKISPTPAVLSAAERAALLQEVQDDPNGNGYGWDGSKAKAKEIVATLVERPMVPSDPPTKQRQVPLTTTRLFQLIQTHVSEQNQAKIFSKSEAAIEAMAERAREGDAEGAINWGFILKAKGDITEAELSALINAGIKGTETDPTWPAEVKGQNRLSEVIGREIGGLTVAELAETMETTLEDLT